MIRRMMILLLSLVFGLVGFPAWADDDAIIDIDNHVATFTGTWGTNNTPILFYGDDFRWAACSGSTSITAEATFSSSNIRSDGTAIYPDISGEYAVYVRWVVHPNRTTNAKYRIYDGTTYRGTCVTTMDQTKRGGEWIYCNTVTLTPGNAAVVKLGNDCEAGKYVIADAVRFVRISKDKDDIVDGAGADSTGGDLLFPLSGTDSIVKSVTISAPSAGHVIVIASGYLRVNGGNGSGGRCTITTGNSVDDNNLIAGGYAGETTNNNTIFFPLAGVRGFTVSSAGSQTYNLVCSKWGPTGVTAIDVQLGAIFVPKTY